ncbi:MAG: hypothetical protein ABI432_08720 [Flavobacteriales bacterium]
MKLTSPHAPVKLQVITLWQPWATWIALGFKTIETRTHGRFASLSETRIGIHAGHHWDEEAYALARAYMTDAQIGITESYKNVRGALVATAFVTEHRELRATDSRASLLWVGGEPKRFGLVLENVERLDPPMPMQGKQGIWSINVTAAK